MSDPFASLPTHRELLRLPHSARAGLAAWVANQVGSLYSALWPHATPDQIDAVQKAMLNAESIAEMVDDTVSSVGRSIQAARRAAAAADAVGADLRAVCAAYAAAVACEAATLNGHHAKRLGSMNSADAAIRAIQYGAEANRAIIRALRAGYDRLLKEVEVNRAKTMWPKEFFNPPWPDPA